MLVGLLGLVLDVSVAIGGCLGFSLKLSTMPTIVFPFFFLLIANLHWRFSLISLIAGSITRFLKS